MLVSSAIAEAQAPQVTRNDYALELFQGPVLAPQRVTSLGGAYIASAEGVEGAAVNSASPSVRDPFSLKWFDYDLGLGFQVPGAFAATDFDNRGAGRGTVGDFVKLDVGLNLQFGHFGACATGDLQQYDLSPASAGAPGLTMQIGRWKGLASYGLFNGQVHLGAGVRVVSMQITQTGEGGTLLTMTGASPELGALIMPDGSQWRIGTTFRAGVNGKIFGSDKSTVDSEGIRRAGAVILPTEVGLPWEAELGVAYQLGPRPLNPPWLNPHDQERFIRARIDRARERRAASRVAALVAAPPSARPALEKKLEQDDRTARVIEDSRLESARARLYKVRKARYQNWPREKILLMASVLMTGASDASVSLQGFLDQRRELVGDSLSFTPRLGIEGEPITHRLRTRVGTYLEPSRYETGVARQHFTFGGDLKLFDFDVWGLIAETTWRLSLFVDLAPRYTNGGISIGTWH